MTALRAEGCGIALSGDEYKVSVTDSPFCIIWHEKHYVDQPPSVAFPPFGALRHHLPPAERWDNKDPQGNPFISYTTISTGCSATVHILHRMCKLVKVSPKPAHKRAFLLIDQPNCGGSPAKRARGEAVTQAKRGWPVFTRPQGGCMVLYKLAPSII